MSLLKIERYERLEIGGVKARRRDDSFFSPLQIGASVGGFELSSVGCHKEGNFRWKLSGGGWVRRRERSNRGRENKDVIFPFKYIRK